MATSTIKGKVIPSWEYVGDVYWWGDSWTCPADGFIEVVAEPNSATWKWFISNSKAADTGWSHRLAGANATTVSYTFFVKKDAVLSTVSGQMSGIGAAHVYYYKFV